MKTVAGGHFMGKKSLEPPGSSLLKTAPHVSLGEQRLQLSHDLLRILLLKKALAMSPRGPAPHTQYRRPLVQMLQK
uniref:Neuromedin B n=1 Tax=Pipistrellus kuhlii TaxID=59472 RepID=A0A7J7S518_PIPKU|nr:neuromedin B [Pipistrellus kuhlii]